MSKFVYILIGNSGDGSNHLNFYDGSIFTKEQIYEAADKDKYDSYQSGDGVQIETMEFPDIFDVTTIKGIYFEDVLPGIYDY
jgi:hypothetical protein